MATTASRPLRTIVVLLALIAAMFGSIAIGAQFYDDASDETGPSFAPNLALDLEGGVQLILTPQLDPDAEGEDAEITTEDMDQAIEIIRQRVDASGVAEAEITRQGANNIVVGLPGNPSAETLDLVRQSAQLRFRPVLTIADPAPIDPSQEGLEPVPDDAPVLDSPDAEPGDVDGGDDAGATGDPAPADAQEGTEGQAPSTEEIEAAAFQVADADGDGQLSTEPEQQPTSNSDLSWITEQLLYDMYTLDCTDPANLTGGLQDDPSQPLVACAQDGVAKYVLGPTDVEGTNVASATSGLEALPGGGTTNNWVVNIEFDGEGTEQFSETSQRLVNLTGAQNQFGIVLDGLVISAPSMNAAILDGQAQISGSFTRDSANTLANQLNFGSLPLNFEVQSEEQISATLGSEHLRIGLIAGISGLVLVALYMAWQYRALAAVAVSSLLMAALTTYGAILVLSWLQGYRLSLAGVAGLIVAVGITADSFILYFERIRDEVREGRALSSAVQLGWLRARRTIIISDLVTLLAAVILYFLSVGGVRGFAFTLGLVTFIDLAVFFLFTHPMLQALIRTRFFGEGHRLSGLNAETLGATNVAYRGRGRIERVGEPHGGQRSERSSGSTRAEDMELADNSSRADDTKLARTNRADGKDRAGTKELAGAGSRAGGSTLGGGDRPTADSGSTRMTIAERRAAERRAEQEAAAETEDAR